MGQATDVRILGRLPFQYSLLFTSVAAAKLLHLYGHLTSLPPVLYILYLPTFLALDAVNAVIFWSIVHFTAGGRLSLLLAFTRWVICLGILGAASSQISFFLETGAELKWGQAGNFAHDAAGIKLLLSGSLTTFLVAVALAVVARVISQPLYNFTDALFSIIITAFTRQPKSRSKEWSETSEEEYTGRRLLPIEEETLSSSGSEMESSTFLPGPVTKKEKTASNWFTRIKILTPIVIVTILLIVRPRHFPFAHMSGSLPFTLMAIWSANLEELCKGDNSGLPPQFPLTNLLSKANWEPPKGRYPGWKPVANVSGISGDQSLPRPSWLPKEEIPGFERWYSVLGNATQKNSDEEIYLVPSYNPVTDPMRITNLDHDLLEELTNAFKDRKVAIKHVVILNLESTRKDVFPLKKESHLHDLIMDTWGAGDNTTDVESELAKVSTNAEILTGETSGFDITSPEGSGWRSTKKDRGGINVLRAFTGSTSTFKSMIGSHCGVQPLPVDFTVEAESHIYQPCIPSILDLFNRNKKGSATRDSVLGDASSQPWKSVFVQSITDQFDHQDELNQKIGFSEVIVKSTLQNSSSKYFPPKEKESNYFGFPEAEVKPYLRDLFHDAEKNGERLFLSHFTSSTHHPWNTPEEAGETIDFLKKRKWRSESRLNRYLNTVKYVDNWIGEIMDMIEEVGIAEQTLVVMVGDHGWAFQQDSAFHSTFENGHIANVRVPLAFYHPSLPRMHLDVNATSMSIIPTLLDLLVSTSSLDTKDSDIATDLIHQYEGQSLLRPFQKEKNGRQQWNVGVLNAGGAVLSVSSAAVPWRLVLPICKAGVYRFTSTDTDPYELHPIEGNSISELVKAVSKKHSDLASQWVHDAEKIAKYWVLEQRRRWRYTGESLMENRKPTDMIGQGSIKKEHWWDT